jgi:hypothetical protein
MGQQPVGREDGHHVVGGDDDVVGADAGLQAGEQLVVAREVVLRDANAVQLTELWSSPLRADS